jgi:hypothetical protein
MIVLKRNAHGEICKNMNFSFKYHRPSVIFKYVNWYPGCNRLKDTAINIMLTHYIVSTSIPISIYLWNWKENSSVSKVTSLWTRWPGFDSWQGRILPFAALSRLALGPPSVLSSGYWGSALGSKAASQKFDFLYVSISVIYPQVWKNLLHDILIFFKNLSSFLIKSLKFFVLIPFGTNFFHPN